MDEKNDEEIDFIVNQKQIIERSNEFRKLLN
jgi:hypothetical protein